MQADRWRRGFPAPEDDLGVALLDAGRRAAVIQAAVVHRDLAERVLAAIPALLRATRPKSRAVGLATAHALCARSLTQTIYDAYTSQPEAFVGVADPLDRDQTLAHRVLGFFIEVARPTHAGARAVIADAMAVPGLRPLAWRALGEAPAAASLPHLAALLDEAPELAGEVGTRYALIHTAHVVAASEAIAALPEATRRAYAEALEKHLKRIFAVRTWVACRRVLFGR